ncbi:hypothetical protein CDAR_104861 [Caerostris darwini]|uniref:Uncharacterized protein n=1 Tax=Caerostris darwini TaxID=1538125 RepID=A0AAV4W3V1_9ARAC|nr:hypothetical protein CDAR_104861 [Caerostris darwini]
MFTAVPMSFHHISSRGIFHSVQWLAKIRKTARNTIYMSRSAGENFFSLPVICLFLFFMVSGTVIFSTHFSDLFLDLFFTLRDDVEEKFIPEQTKIGSCSSGIYETCSFSEILMASFQDHRFMADTRLVEYKPFHYTL